MLGTRPLPMTEVEIGRLETRTSAWLWFYVCTYAHALPPIPLNVDYYSRNTRYRTRAIINHGQFPSRTSTADRHRRRHESGSYRLENLSWPFNWRSVRRGGYNRFCNSMSSTRSTIKYYSFSYGINTWK